MLDDIDVPELSARSGVKWARATAAGAIPAWIADMDFPVAEPILAAIRDADHGYPAWEEDPRANPLIDVYVDRTEALHGHRPDPGSVRFFTETIQALQVILHVATEPGDAVAMHTPSYPPFLKTVERMGRRLVPIPMIDTGGGWAFDVDRHALAGCRALILVNPQNPTGRVFTRDELTALAGLAERHDLLVIADEVHSELVYEPHRHLPFAPFAPGRTVTLATASKAFNLAGLRCAIADVAAPRVRKALDALPDRMLGQPGTPGIVATLAAWEHGGPWLAEVRTLLERNRRLVAEGLGRHHSPEATYLAWLDLRSLGGDPAGRILAESGVMLSPGPQFGPGGAGYARLNFATSRPVLDEILGRLAPYAA
ncbi:MalY/PatB family protein [Actinoplanes utahensis]|uniref:cysteine-S-conjugate beta-lyase n=1 Tax=Actinoplanes utahensis TaxID=1869 RepID=A0A0A6UUN0_ACTUT|nr:aminotransferase class I/II-fold pyridoxal phosphate-dependent enzyme [Actinoplanes utahensis]KHD78164.1 aminotransferase [Actinoplanes utahensis]GIF30661.1 aminotransferase [Actinoplanes utahensis]